MNTLLNTIDQEISRNSREYCDTNNESRGLPVGHIKWLVLNNILTELTTRSHRLHILRFKSVNNDLSVRQKAAISNGVFDFRSLGIKS